MFDEMIKNPKRTEDGKWIFNDQEMISLCIWVYYAATGFTVMGLPYKDIMNMLDKRKG